MKEYTKLELIDILSENDWYIGKASKQIGIGRWVLKNLMNLHGIKAKRTSGERPGRKEWNCKNQKNFYKARNTWYKINRRCHLRSDYDYNYYGARGISVSECWRSSLDEFYNYCVQFENAFKPGFSIDRIDNNGNYEPGNVRFVKHKVQCNNRRSNRLYEFKNITQTIAQWAEQYNLKWEFVRDRLNLGWTIEEALTLPRYSRRQR